MKDQRHNFSLRLEDTINLYTGHEKFALMNNYKINIYTFIF